uniref:Uncharacterized protein n=1 Tax=Tanacetum cinerariifolium TaxID=118510 RepID=A0A699JJF7_TANCI|nr:hypothetical protein [Tanacetum cinerariifolium]
MACPLPHTFDEIQALVTKLIDEYAIRQKALMELAELLELQDEEVLRQTLEEEARAEKEWEEKMKQEKTEYDLFALKFGVQSDSEYDTD